MAYCPHCGKRNTEQATACVSCGEPFEPEKKPGGSKLKGTMMMGGARPEGAPPKNTPRSRPPSQPPEPKPPSGGRFKKTMLGPAAAAPPPPATTADASEPRPETDPAGTAAPPAEGATGFEPTQQALPNTAFDTQRAPQDEPPVGATDPTIASQPPPPRASPGPASDLGGPAAFPGEEGIPGARNPRALLYMGAGCLAALVLVAVITAVVSSGPILAFLGLADEATTAAEGVVMRGTAVMTLQRVHAACSSGSCDAAADAFHPKVREALLPRAEAVDEAMLDHLSDLDRSNAEPLDETDDAALAEDLGIPPEQCSRLAGGDVKVVTCGNEDGTPRIIHLEASSTK